MSTIQFIQVSKYFPASKTTALKNVSLVLPDRGMVFVVGKSGSGKSTLLNLLGGLEKASEGQILFRGKDIESFSEKEWDRYRKEAVSFCFQKFNVFPNLTVEENIRFAEKRYSLKKIYTICKRVGLESLEKRKVSTLSGGQQQRVAIARALYRDSPILLCDEPTGSLDSKTAAQVFQCLREIASAGRLVVVVTHDEASAKEFGDRLIRLSDGAAVEDLPLCSEEKEQPTEEASLTPASKAGGEKRSFLSHRIAARSLFHRPFRLIIATLLLGLSIGAFLPLLSTAIQGPATMLARSAIKGGDHYVAYSKTSFRTTKRGPRNMFAEDVEALSPDSPSLPIYRRSRGLYMGQENGSFLLRTVLGPKRREELEGQKPVYKEVCDTESSLGVMDQKTADAFHFSLLAGRYPSASDECLLTRVQYDSLKQFGFHNTTSSYQAEEIATPEAFLSLAPKISLSWAGDSYAMTIVGILDTNFNETRYAKFKQQDSAEESLSAAALDEELNHGPHTVIFVSPSFASEYLKETSVVSINYSFSREILTLQSKIPTDFADIKNADEWSDSVISLAEGKEGCYLPAEQFSSLWSETSITLPSDIKLLDYAACVDPYTDFAQLGQNGRWNEVSTFFGGKSWIDFTGYNSYLGAALLAAGNYVDQNGLPTGSDYKELVNLASLFYSSVKSEESQPDFSSPSDKEIGYLKSFYVRYLSTYQEGYFANAFGGPSGVSLTHSLAEKVMEKSASSFQPIKVHMLSKASGDGYAERNFDVDVLGVALETSRSFYAQKPLFDDLKLRFADAGDISYLLTPIPSQKKLASEIHGVFKSTGRYHVGSPTIATYEEFSEYFYDPFITTVKASAIALLVLSALALVFLFLAYAKDRGSEMLLRRAMGESKARVYWLLSEESILVGLIGFAASLPIGFLFAYLTNTYLSHDAGLSWQLFTVSFPGIIIALLIVLAVCFLTAAFPAYQGAKKGLATRLKQDE